MPESTLSIQQVQALLSSMIKDPLPLFAAEALTFYVDAVNGSDANTGSQAAPFRTINMALSKIPPFHVGATINLLPGTYDETLNIRTVPVDFNKILTIQGTAFTPATPATGPQTGTFTGVSSWGATMNAAGWTASDLKGVLCKVTSGSKSGTYYPIADNTVDTLDIGLKTATALNGATFELVIPAAKITKAASEDRTARVWSSSMGITSPSVLFQNLDIQPGTGRGIVVASGGNAMVRNCRVVSATYSLYSYVGGVVSAQNSYLGVTGSTGVVVNGYGDAVLSNCVLSGPGAGTVIGAIFAGPSAGASGLNKLTDCIVQGLHTGVQVSNSYANLISTLVRTCTQRGVVISQAGAFTNFTGCKLTANAIGLLVMFSGFNCWMDSTDIVNNTGDGVQVQDGHASILTSGTAAVTGNGGFGFNLCNNSLDSQVSSIFNVLKVANAITMNTNTGGDVSLDGTTASTIAAIRAVVGPPAKTVTDTNKFNRVVAT